MITLEDILNEDNINRAISSIHKANKMPGIDGMKSRELREYWNKHSDEITNAIQNQKYYPNLALSIPIKKKGSKAKRRLEVPTVLDRMLLTSIHNILAPYFNPQFSDSSFGFRPHRGTYNAVFKALNHINSGYHTIVKIDIKSFFDHVHHKTLFHRLEEDIKDERLLMLIRRFVKIKVSHKNHIYQKYEGLSQGSSLSPLLANLYLDEFDKYLEQKQITFIRYADDIMLFCENPESAHKVLLLCTDFLKLTLKLDINTQKTVITSPENIDFLSYSFMKSNNGNYHLTISDKIETKMLARMQHNINRPSQSNVAWWVRQAAFNRGWINYFQYADPEKMSLFLAYAEIMQIIYMRMHFQSLSIEKSQSLINALYDCPHFSSLTGWFFTHTVKKYHKTTNYIERMKSMSNKYAYNRSHKFYEKKDNLKRCYSSITSTPFYYIDPLQLIELKYPVTNTSKSYRKPALTDIHKAILKILYHNKTLTSWQINAYLLLRGHIYTPEEISQFIFELCNMRYINTIQIQSRLSVPKQKTRCQFGYYISDTGLKCIAESNVYIFHHNGNSYNPRKSHLYHATPSILCNQIVFNQLTYSCDLEYFNIEFMLNLPEKSVVVPLQVQTYNHKKMYHFQYKCTPVYLKKIFHIWSLMQQRSSYPLQFVLVIHSLDNIRNKYLKCIKNICSEEGLDISQIYISVASSWFLPCPGIEIPLEDMYNIPIEKCQEAKSKREGNTKETKV